MALRQLKGYSNYSIDSKKHQIFCHRKNKYLNVYWSDNIGYFSKLYNDRGYKKILPLAKALLKAENQRRVNYKFIDGNRRHLSLNNLILTKIKVKHTIKNKEDKISFYKRYVLNSNNYQRLVLRNNKLSLIENIFIDNKKDRLEFPNFIKSPKDTIETIELIFHNFKKYNPSKDELRFFIDYEIDLGVINKI